MYLPLEIISTIFEYADPNTLISAAMVSRAWKQRSTDSRLWRRLFVQEGWIYDSVYLEQFETNARRQIRSLRSFHDTQTTEDINMDSDDQDTISKHIAHHRGPIRLWMKNARLGFKRPAATAREHEQTNEQRRLSNASCDETMNSAVDNKRGAPANQEDRRIYTPLLESDDLLDRSSNPRLDWRYLYKQRRRLEDNWNIGRCSNFRLPRHDHPEEAHTQCVYTMQFSNKHVVTGSRDRTVRIWDLESRRLKLPPLTGHCGSVLCLQFDESPEQDVLISGGSDSDVIIWTFSTGHMFKRLKSAHAESVLNLCFDHRYLITCSKDKTIKVWNRKSLLPSDAEYPPSNQAKHADFPEYIVNLPDLVNLVALNRIQPLERYSLLMTLIGHNAAVNAIQVHEDRIVSASGDRKIFLWSISQGQLLRQFSGHTKGIACVQFDGKRIVSGSSDKTVRVFDSGTGAELAVLAGHRELVRTVQADFADSPGSDVDYKAQAKAYDKEIAQLRRAGKLRAGMLSAMGADLPRGGGGNEWSKIVSGSYDETVTIWKKGRGGTWNVLRELSMRDHLSPSEQARADMPDPLSAVDAIFPGNSDLVAGLNGTVHRDGMTHRLPTGMPLVDAAFNPATERNSNRDHVMEGAPTTTTANAQTPSQTHIPAHLNPQHPLYAYSAPPRTELGTGMSSTLPPLAYATHDAPLARPAQRNLPIPLQPVTQPINAPRPSSYTPSQPATLLAHTQTLPTEQARLPISTISNTTDATTSTTNPSTTNASLRLQSARAQPDPNARPPAQAHRHRLRPPPPLPNPDNLFGASRVFKLQFNARFIMCCSQQPVVVGWDFANGDKELEEASAFFGMPRGS